MGGGGGLPFLFALLCVPWLAGHSRVTFDNLKKNAEFVRLLRTLVFDSVGPYLTLSRNLSRKFYTGARFCIFWYMEKSIGAQTTKKQKILVVAWGI